MSKKIPWQTNLPAQKIIVPLILTVIISSFIIMDMTNKINKPVLKKTSYDKSASFSVLSANVGNLNLGCRKVLNKLCYKDVEERITANIKYLSPDIIALQEVLAPWQCKEINETDNNKICSETQLVPQVRRLVGEDYTIACNSRNQFECIAIKKDFGEITNCPKGEFCYEARTAPEIKGCDNGFTISAVTIKAPKIPFLFDVINFHPQSTNSDCRAKMINTALYGNKTATSIIQEEKVVLLGDFNLDPWRDNDESVIIWSAFMKNGWSESNLEYHNEITETGLPLFTSLLFYKPRTLDFVVSNFTNGTCSTLGETPNTSRLDDGEGTDHRSLFGILSLR